MKSMIRANMIRNCPVTTKDVDAAEKIYGKSDAVLKGRTTRRKPNPVIDDTIDLPRELRERFADLVLCMDNIFICGLCFLAMIDKTIRVRNAFYLKNRQA